MKKAISLLLAVLLCFGLFACSSESNPSGSESSSVPSSSTSEASEPSNGEENEEKVLTLLGFLEPGGESAREQGAGELLKVFTENTGYTLECEIVGWEQVEQKLIVAVQSDDAPDVTFVRSQSLSIEVNGNILMPLTEYIERDFDQETIDDYLLWDQVGMYQGVKYTLPMSIIPYGMYYRTDIFDEYGIEKVPETWDEFLTTAQTINSNEASGYLFFGSAEQPSAIDLLQPFVEGFGGKLIDENELGVFDTPEAIKAFELIKSMVYDYEIVPSTIVSLTYDQASDMFAAGRSATYIDGSHRYSKYAEGIGTDNLALGKIPGPEEGTPSPSYVSYWSLGIPRNSKNPDMAWEYMKNFTTPENQATYSEISGEVCVRKSALEDPFFETEDGQVIKWFVDYVSESGTVAIAPLKFNELSEILSIAVQDIISSPDSDVEAIVKQACADYNAIVEG